MGTEQLSFSENFRKATIQSNRTSIGTHKDNIIMNLEQIIKGEISMQCPLIQDKVNKLNAIDYRNMGLDIVEPMIGIAAQLEGVIGSPIDADIALVKGHIEEFKNTLYSTLVIAQEIKDTRINRHIFAATDLFTKNFLSEEQKK